jgi:hypothetical protein
MPGRYAAIPLNVDAAGRSKINPMGRRGYFILGFLAILLSISSFAVVLSIDWLREVSDDLIYDSKKHYLPCDELPTAEETARVVSDHQEVVQQIEQVHPGLVKVQVDTRKCPGRADIAITYPSHRDRVEIEKIINGNTFFGIPYRLINI